MNKTSSLVRFVDVVLILLFGFISISEVTQQSKIKLPESVETPPSYPDKEEIIFIGVTPEGNYLVENESKLITSPRQLRRYVADVKRRYEARNLPLRIRIRANWDSPIKYTIRAADICDQLGIPKGIDVRLKSGRRAR
jgi:biopolymer transport protein ExbD